MRNIVLPAVTACFVLLAGCDKAPEQATTMETPQTQRGSISSADSMMIGVRTASEAQVTIVARAIRRRRLSEAARRIARR